MSKTASSIITVLAHDPGSTNYGYAVIKGTLIKDRLHFKVVENGKIRNTIKQMKFRKIREKEREAYAREVGKIIKKHKPDFQIAERYMTRGIKGILIECVSSMLNTLELRFDTPLKLIPAVTWKTELKKCEADFKEWYKKCRTTPHQLDSAGMGIYAIMKFLNVPRQKIDMWKLIAQLEETSEEELINRKSRR